MKGFIRTAAVSLPMHLGDVNANETEISIAIEALRMQGVQLAVFPELCLCGATLGDLLLQPMVTDACMAAAKRLAGKVGDMTVVVGLPVQNGDRLENCAAVLQGGRIAGLVSKSCPGGALGDDRWFTPGSEPQQDPLAPASRRLFRLGECTFAVVFGSDLASPLGIANAAALSGAEVILCPDAVNALAGGHQARVQQLCSFTAAAHTGCVYACAGFGESTADLVFDGWCGVAENGKLLAEGKRFGMTDSHVIADIDVERLRFKRQRDAGFRNARGGMAARRCPVPVTALADPTPFRLPLMRPIDPVPFLPEGKDADQRMLEIINIQTTALMTRLKAIWCKDITIGISGGLDSTMAVLIAARAFDGLSLPRTGIHAITMPGMGTGKRTKSNADRLMEALGVHALEIDIKPAVLQHFKDIGQPEDLHDTTYENCQARERTQILMDYANKVNGIVLGTGDMSEEALGFCTYNGDHMSMYNPNCTIPKTLMRGLVKYMSENCFGGAVKQVCADILDTPVSPELLPNITGELTQRTEDILGDYALHDFFLYHQQSSGASPDKLRMLALQAFDGVYGEDVVDKQLSTFVKKFYTQQFKRNCVPDGPKVGTVGLSPRGDWQMPSDMVYALWKGQLK
ncbi:MAG: NAD(+) synthase [Clostridia bacterium]|nr:NAD(+) synthase [Clostridia bacterium]